MPNVLQTIQLLVAPVVMISACGLLCLALYNRLAAIVSRARAFHKERFDAQARLATGGAKAENDPVIRQLRRRVDLLDEQVDQILRRAALVRGSVVLLLVTVLCMLACSVALGLSVLAPVSAVVALALFLLGVVAAMVAMLLAILELRRALDPVLLESTVIDEMDELT